MTRLYNVDHQTAILDHGDHAVAPGRPHDFPDEQIAAGLAGQWSELDPRRGLPQERVWKKRRDAQVAVVAIIKEPTSTPATEVSAEPEDDKEN